MVNANIRPHESYLISYFLRSTSKKYPRHSNTWVRKQLCGQRILKTIDTKTLFVVMQKRCQKVVLCVRTQIRLTKGIGSRCISSPQKQGAYLCEKCSGCPNTALAFVDSKITSKLASPKARGPEQAQPQRVLDPTRTIVLD